MNQYWMIPGDNALHESTSTHGAESQQNPLVKLDPGLFIWTILTFVLLSIILAKFAWKPLLAMLDERNKSIEDSLLSAEKARKELENINQESEVILTKAKTEAQSMISDAKSAADNLKDDIVIPAGTYDLTFFPSSPRNPQQGNLKIETPKGGQKKNFAPKPQYGTGVRV